MTILHWSSLNRIASKTLSKESYCHYCCCSFIWPQWSPFTVFNGVCLSHTDRPFESCPPGLTCKLLQSFSNRQRTSHTIAHRHCPLLALITVQVTVIDQWATLSTFTLSLHKSVRLSKIAICLSHWVTALSAFSRCTTWLSFVLPPGYCLIKWPPICHSWPASGQWAQPLSVCHQATKPTLPAVPSPRRVSHHLRTLPRVPVPSVELSSTKMSGSCTRLRVRAQDCHSIRFPLLPVCPLSAHYLISFLLVGPSTCTSTVISDTKR